MKIENLNILERVQQKFKPSEEENLLSISLSIEDANALQYLATRWHMYGTHCPHAEAARKAISKRHDIEKLTLTKTTDRTNNYFVIRLEKDERMQLTKEAAELRLSINDYVRGILFSLNQKLKKEDAAEYDRQIKIRQDNRKIPVQLILNKELREKLFTRFEKELKDEELLKKLRRKMKGSPRTITKDRMLQEVLRNHLLKYLNG